MKKTYEELGREIEELMEGLPKHKPAPTSKQHEENLKRNPIKYDMTPLPEMSNKKRPCAPYGWEGCKSKYVKQLKNIPEDGIYEFHPYNHLKYEKNNNGHDGQEIRIQEYLTQVNEEGRRRDSFIEKTYNNMVSRSKKLSNYNEEGINVPEKMNANRLMFGSAKGDSRRFSCPKCWFEDGIKVTVNEYGYCPNGHGNVYSNSVHFGGAMKRMRAKDPFILMQAGKLIEEDLYEYTVRYTVNKKSDGRNPNGFLEVNAISDNLHRHNVPCVNKPRALYRPTSRQVKYGNIKKEIWKVEISEPCECGCKVSAYDEKHGVTFCPKCGLVN